LSPTFGVECTYEDDESRDAAQAAPIIEDNVQVVETGYETNLNALRMRYQVGKSKKNDNNEKAELELNQDLGLACEKLPKGVEVDNLWKIV